jgi:hypothetical protein
MVRTLLASTLALFLFAIPSFAAEPVSEATSEQTSAARPIVMTPFAAAVAAVSTAPLAAAPAVVQNDAQKDWYKNSRRPAVLPALYVSSALLQGFDAYSTLRALKAGAVEANPLMKSATGNPLAFIGIKAAVTATSILAAERMWRNHNRTGAIVTMVVSNGMMALVAQHNASVLSGLPR